MASVIDDFITNNQKLSYRFLADLDKTGSFTDYTDNVVSMDCLQTIDRIFGIIDVRFDAELFFESPSVNWARRGREVEAYISTTGDDWSTNYEAKLFKGSTNKNAGVPVDRVRLKASGLNSDYLDRTLEDYATDGSYTLPNTTSVNTGSRRIWKATDINTIIEDLLVAVGVDSGDISLSSYGTTINYMADGDRPIREYIEELAIASGQIVGFERDGVFRASDLVKLGVAGASLTTDAEFTLATQFDFEPVTIDGEYFCNSINVRGNYVEVIELEAGGDPMYYEGDITGYEVASGGTFYYIISESSLKPVYLASLQFPTAKTNEYYEPNYLSLTGTTAPTSHMEFRTSDNRAEGANYTDITVENYFIADGDIVIEFKNTGASTAFLKSLMIFGVGLRVGNPLRVQRRFDNLITEVGEVVDFSTKSLAIQTPDIINNIANLVQLNMAKVADTYRFKVVGYPALKVGSLIEFEDMNEDAHIGLVFQVDEEVEDMFDAELTVKVIETFDLVDVNGDNIVDINSNQIVVYG